MKQKLNKTELERYIDKIKKLKKGKVKLHLETSISRKEWLSNDYLLKEYTILK